MNWIKQYYDRFLLLLLAVALIVSSVLIILGVKSFPARFAEVLQKVTPRSELPKAETQELEEATAAIAKPATWQGAHPGSLFVSRKYLNKDGKLVDPLEDDTIMLHPPVPNQWLLSHNLDILDPNVLVDDPDGDRFSNLDEFSGGTDPLDKASHPAYTTKLRLKQYLRRQFRLKFAAYDGDSFQINTLDLHRPSQFLTLGEQIGGTKFKILKFEKKQALNPNTGVDTDVSELTIQNVENQDEVVLILEKVVDSPDSFALFKFLWDGKEFPVKKGQNFKLSPEPSVEYKLIDINEKEALITNLNTNAQVKVPRLDEAGNQAAR